MFEEAHMANIPDPRDAFAGRNELELRLTDEAWDYLRGVAALMVEFDRNPSWVKVIDDLGAIGIACTDRPLRRVLLKLVDEQRQQ